MSDIVDRLRAMAGPIVPNVCTEAADEIERLRELLKNSYGFTKTLTAERDEARREVLLWMKERCSWTELSQEIKKRGWDCFKEDGK